MCSPFLYLVERSGRRGWTRTSDHLLRRQVLYPPELRAHSMYSRFLTHVPYYIEHGDFGDASFMQELCLQSLATGRFSRTDSHPCLPFQTPTGVAYTFTAQ